MTKKNSLVAKVKLSDVVKTDATVDMNSIVAFFISKYETQLLENKKQLSNSISEKTTYLSGAFITEVEKEVNLNSFIMTIPILEFTTTAVINTESPFRQGKVDIDISSTKEDNHCFNFYMTKEVKLSEALHTKYMDVMKELDALRSSLRETLENISSISRKERELRGALAEKTLREAGVGELFEDEALLRLVNLPQLVMKTVK